MAAIAITRAVTAVVPRAGGEDTFGGVDEGLAADGLFALAVGAVLDHAVADAELVEAAARKVKAARERKRAVARILDVESEWDGVLRTERDEGSGLAMKKIEKG
ncbi:MAG: hypothetical protein Q9173_003190 [Seirophora scorigena]